MDYSNAGYASYPNSIPQQQLGKQERATDILGGCAQPPQRQLAIPERLEQFETSLYELLNTLSRIEDSLVGPSPCDPNCKNEPGQYVDGLLSRISRQIEAAHESANVIHRQIVRG